MSMKLSSESVRPVSVRVHDLKPGQVGIQLDKDHVWMRVNDRLIFRPRFGEVAWQMAPHNNTKVFVEPLPQGTEVSFKSAA